MQNLRSTPGLLNPTLPFSQIPRISSSLGDFEVSMDPHLAHFDLPVVSSVTLDLIHTEHFRRMCPELKIRQSPSPCTFSFSWVSRLSHRHSSCLKAHTLNESLDIQKEKKNIRMITRTVNVSFELWKQTCFSRFKSLCLTLTYISFHMVHNPLKIVPEKNSMFLAFKFKFILWDLFPVICEESAP